MSFSFTVNQTVSKGIKKLLNWQVDQALQAGALELGGLISDEADKGRGLRGGFKAYSKGYSNRLSRSGKSTKPDLQLSGELMRSVINPDMKFSKRKGYKQITISLSDRTHTGTDLTIAELAEIQHKRRPFFGVTKRYERIINKIVIKELEREYAKLNLD